MRANAGVGVQRTGPGPFVGARVGLFSRTDARLKLALPTNPTGEGVHAPNLELGLGVTAYAGDSVSIVVLPQYRYYRAIQDDADAALDEYSLPDHQLTAFAMPVLVAFRTPRNHTFFAGPTGHVGTRDKQTWAAFGAHLGATLRIGSRVSVTPSFGLLITAVGPEQTRDEYGDLSSHLLARGRAVPEFGFSWSFGSRE